MSAQHNLGPQFHATYVQGWSPERLPPDKPVHVGSRAAAESRIHGVYELAEHHANMGVEADFKNPTLHEVEVTGRVHPQVFHDNPQLHDALLHRHPDYDAFAYANDHEDIGQVSYAVRPSALRVRRTERLSPPDHLNIELF